MDKCTYDYLTLFAQWACAIGTIGATIAALHFARRDRSVKMDIICEKAKLTSQINDYEIDIITIRITNLGYREFIIDHLYWRLPFDKTIYIQDYNAVSQDSDSIPIKLVEGNIGNFPIRLSDFEENAKKFIDSIKFCPSLLSRFIRIGVYTTLKKKHEKQIGKDLSKWILSKR